MNTFADETSDLEEASFEKDGSRPRIGVRGWVGVGVGLAALTAGAAAWGLAVADEPVRFQDVGFEITSDTEASATYDVFLYTDAVVTCHVRALNIRFSEVGVATATIDPALGAEQRITTTMATTERANTAVVHYCEPAQ